MRPEANRNKLIIALKRAIADTFDDGKWRELGYLSDTIQIIENHDRLLRSLYWGDNDYEGCILQVLPTIIGLNNEKLSLVENFVGLEAWLKENDLPLYAELYGGGDLIPLSHVEEASHTLDVIELNRHAARIRHGIDNDPAQAIGSAKELLETVLKIMLGEHGATSSDDIHALLRKAQQQLNLEPRADRGNLPGAETIRRTLSNLGQLVIGIFEMRNLYGTGHGRSRGPELEIAHARLVVNAAISVATFLLEVWLAPKDGR